MSPEPESNGPELDESTWVYLAAHQRRLPGTDRTLTECLSEACESLGFAVYAAGSAHPTSATHEWVEALRHAEVCVIDVGAASAASGAELAMAYCSARPVVALRVRHESLPHPIADILENYPAARELVFEDASDCVAQLRQVFADPEWQRTVRSAAIAEEPSLPCLSC